jgi:hypothetical protein
VGAARAKRQSCVALAHTGLARRSRTFSLHFRKVAPCPLGDRESGRRTRTRTGAPALGGRRSLQLSYTALAAGIRFERTHGRLTAAYPTNWATLLYLVQAAGIEPATAAFQTRNAPAAPHLDSVSGRGGPSGPPPAPGGDGVGRPLRPDARMFRGGSPGTCTPNTSRCYLFSRQVPRLAGRLPYLPDYVSFLTLFARLAASP